MEIPTHRSAVVPGIAFALLTIGAQSTCQKEANLGSSGDSGTARADTGSTAGDTSARDAGRRDAYAPTDTRAPDSHPADTGPGSTDGGNDASDTGRSDTDAGVSDPYEPNDSPSTADFIQANPGSKADIDSAVERKVAYAAPGDVDWYFFTHKTSKSNETDMFVEFLVALKDTSAALDVELMRTTRSGGVKRVEKASRNVVKNLSLVYTTNSASVQDVVTYSVRHQPKSKNDETYFLKVSGAQSRVRYLFSGYERRSDRADTPSCSADGAEPNDQLNSATTLQSLSQITQLPVWYNNSTDVRLCSGDSDIYRVNLSGGEAYEFTVVNFETSIPRLSVQASSAVTFANKDRDRWFRRAFTTQVVELPSGTSSADVYITVENSKGLPYVGSYMFGYRRTK